MKNPRNTLTTLLLDSGCFASPSAQSYVKSLTNDEVDVMIEALKKPKIQSTIYLALATQRRASLHLG